MKLEEYKEESDLVKQTREIILTPIPDWIYNEDNYLDAETVLKELDFTELIHPSYPEDKYIKAAKELTYVGTPDQIKKLTDRFDEELKKINSKWPEWISWENAPWLAIPLLCVVGAFYKFG